MIMEQDMEQDIKDISIPLKDPKNILLFMKNAYGGVDTKSLSYCISSQGLPPYEKPYYERERGINLSSTQQRHKDIIMYYLTSNKTSSSPTSVSSFENPVVSRRL